MSSRDRSGAGDATLAGVYRRVEPGSVVETVARLRERIDQRFPESGLSRVARELHDVALQSADRARQAMYGMKKIVIADLERAFAGRA